MDFSKPINRFVESMYHAITKLNDDDDDERLWEVTYVDV